MDIDIGSVHVAASYEFFGLREMFRAASPQGRKGRPVVRMTNASGERERARRLLAHEGAIGGNAEASATAAGRVYDKLIAQLGPVLGTAGVRALFERSAKLGRVESLGFADIAILESSTTLATFFRTLDPAVTANATETLFGTFLSLVTTFIGERLTFQALRRAWPTIEATAATEGKR